MFHSSVYQYRFKKAYAKSSVIQVPSDLWYAYPWDVSSAERRDDDKVARREHRIRRSVFFRFNAIANKGLSNRRSTRRNPFPRPIPEARCCARRRSIPEECIGRSLERALALSRKVGRERVGGCARRRREGRVAAAAAAVAVVVRRTRKVEGWSGGTGGAVRAQHDAIRAGTRRSLRSERRDASAESVAWIARLVIAGTRGVPLSSRITLAVCSAEGVVSLLSSCEPPRREEGRRGGGVPYRRSSSCRFDPPGRALLSLSGWPRTDSARSGATRLVFIGFREKWETEGQRCSEPRVAFPRREWSHCPLENGIHARSIEKFCSGGALNNCRHECDKCNLRSIQFKRGTVNGNKISKGKGAKQYSKNNHSTRVFSYSSEIWKIYMWWLNTLDNHDSIPIYFFICF